MRVGREEILLAIVCLQSLTAWNQRTKETSSNVELNGGVRWVGEGEGENILRSSAYAYAPCETCLREYADSEGPDQSAHARTLIRAFTVRNQNHWILKK